MRTLMSAGLMALAVAAPATAASVFTDPQGDFLASYTGTHSAELDVLNFSVGYDYAASSFVLSAKVAGRIHAEGGLYVIGVDTGAGAFAPFGGIGAPDVKFDQVILVQKNGTPSSVTGPSGGVLAANAVSIVNDMFTVRVPSALLASTGFSLGDYAFNLWPRSGLGNNNQISDFAPNNSLITTDTVPEPATWAMLLAGFGAVGVATRRRRPRQLSA